MLYQPTACVKDAHAMRSPRFRIRRSSGTVKCLFSHRKLGSSAAAPVVRYVCSPTSGGNPSDGQREPGVTGFEGLQTPGGSTVGLADSRPRRSRKPAELTSCFMEDAPRSMPGLPGSLGVSTPSRRAILEGERFPGGKKIGAGALRLLREGENIAPLRMPTPKKPGQDLQAKTHYQRDYRTGAINNSWSHTLHTIIAAASCAVSTDDRVDFLLPLHTDGRMGRWQSGQYSLKRSNQSSRQAWWKTCRQPRPRMCALSSISSRQMTLGGKVSVEPVPKHARAKYVPNGVLGLVFGMGRFVLGAPVLEDLRLAGLFEVEHALLAHAVLFRPGGFGEAREEDGGPGGENVREECRSLRAFAGPGRAYIAIRRIRMRAKMVGKTIVTAVLDVVPLEESVIACGRQETASTSALGQFGEDGDGLWSGLAGWQFKYAATRPPGRHGLYRARQAPMPRYLAAMSHAPAPHLTVSRRAWMAPPANRKQSRAA